MLGSNKSGFLSRQEVMVQSVLVNRRQRRGTHNSSPVSVFMVPERSFRPSLGLCVHRGTQKSLG